MKLLTLLLTSLGLKREDKLLPRETRQRPVGGVPIGDGVEQDGNGDYVFDPSQDYIQRREENCQD